MLIALDEHAGAGPTSGEAKPGTETSRDRHPFASGGGGVGSSPFTFLSVFDWTLHKGWDVLLRAFIKEFSDADNVQLVLKVWSTNGYSNDQILEQAAAYCHNQLGFDLPPNESMASIVSTASIPRIRFLFDHLPHGDLLSLYRGADAYVMPSRGEGWGRPYMEAMAIGLPVTGTNWSGNTAFMGPSPSPFQGEGWGEVPKATKPRKVGARQKARTAAHDNETASDVPCASPAAPDDETSSVRRTVGASPVSHGFHSRGANANAPDSADLDVARASLPADPESNLDSSPSTLHSSLLRKFGVVDN
jgi:hypothetical protein